MGVPRAVQDHYARDMDPLGELSHYVSETLAGWCKSRHYGFDTRIKELDSTSEKLESGRFASWLKLDDLVAATVVVPTRSHESSVVTKLDDLFDRKIVRSRETSWMAPDVFRFDATRWYGRAERHPSSQLSPRCHDLLFEIQIHTAFEHAWTTVTHDVVYKAQVVDWRSQRLAAQLKATVEQIDLLIDGFESAASGIPNAPDAATDVQREIIEAFSPLVESGALGEPLVPASWQRFSENVYSLARTRKPRAPQAAELARKTTNDLVAAVLSGEFSLPLSGSLFQAVVGFIVQSDSPTLIEDFPIVWSEELATFYGLDATPKAIELD